MSLASRSSRILARSVRRTRLPERQRRSASSGHGEHHSHGQGESALHLPDANPSGNESFGRGLWVTLAAVPIFYVTYNYATGQSGVLDSLYQTYKEGKEDNARRELLHVAGQQQAIADRAQMKSTPRNMNGPETKNPEMFNYGSPMNVMPGLGTANMKDMEDFMHRQNSQIEEERKSRIVNGMVQTVYDSQPRRTT